MINRAVRTFFQAATGYIVVNIAAFAAGITDGVQTLKGALIALAASALASGIAAVMNLPADGKVKENSKENSTEEKDG
ncbi:MAG: hypothetical protein IKN38_00790 [Clostridia bacterium]|nr:hypothetical protein [Clostridia bacterium]